MEDKVNHNIFLYSLLCASTLLKAIQLKIKAASNDTAKKKLLELIRDHRSTIFGAFSSTITSKQKQEC